MKNVDLISVLSEEECARVRKDVYELRDHWKQRHVRYPFYTLGASSYIDATNLGFEKYSEMAREQNPRLDERFSFLYDKLLAALREEWSVDVAMDDSLARPGFHIYLAHPAFTQQAGSVHFDRQFEAVDWSAFGDVDTDRQKSLTLSIELPAAGSGLRVWNVNYLEFGDLPVDERRRILQENRKAERHPYRTGHLAIHSGHQLHQISPPPRMEEGEARITVQAHAVPTAEKWILYW